MTGAEEAIYFTKPPVLQDLCSIVVTVPIKPEAKNDSPQGQQPQVIRCRELIFTEPDILATPSLLHENNITVIMQQSLYRTGRLQARLQKMGCTSDKPRRVLPSDYQSCLTYTLLARLAPNWNKMGDYLVQGRDFLTSEHKLNGVRFEVHVVEQQMFFSIIPAIIKSPPSKLRDLGVCTPVVREFEYTKPDGRIEEYSIENKWCHILPSMKKGQVIHVYHKLPPDSPFKSYKDIKKHWKNTYGYRLPEDDAGIVYYQVYFKMIGDFLFTYPNICIRPVPVMCFPRSDPGPILETFLADLHTKLPSICGQKLQVSRTPRYPTPSCNPLSEVQGNVNSGLNLTRSAPVNKYGYRPYQTQLSEPQGKPELAAAAKHSQNLMQRTQPEKYQDGERMVRSISGGEQSLGVDGQSNETNKDERYTGSHVLQDAKIVPRFQARPAFRPNLQQPSQNKPSKLIPFFRGNLQKKTPGTSSHNISTTIREPVTNPSKLGPQTSCRPNQTNQNKQQALHQPLLSTRRSSTVRSEAESLERIVPNLTQNNRLENKMLWGNAPTPSAASAPSISEQKSYRGLPHVSSNWYPVEASTAPTFTQSRYQESSNIPSIQQTLPRLTQGPGVGSDAGMFGSQSSQALGSWNAGQNRMFMPDGITMTQGIIPPTQYSTSIKRKHDDNPGSAQLKRVRSKPVVQENINVEELARSGQLPKLNTATLLAWLRGRGIACKAKDKKAELVAKITHALAT